MIRVAACQYEIEGLTWDLYLKKMEFIVLAAKQKEADLIVLPEYSGLEAGGVYHSDEEMFAAVQSKLPQFIKLFQQLADQYEVYIQSGTIPVEVSAGKYVNRAYFFGPNGKHDYQDKLQLVSAETNGGLLVQGEEQKVFETSLGKIGIAVCYDCEFPENVRRLTAAGAWIILVPSYTPSLAAYNRVSISCRARAIENQCYVVAACVVGDVKLGKATAEYAFGRSAIFSPADAGFPDTGIIAKAPMNETAIIDAVLEEEKIALVRLQGATLNFKDAKQLEHKSISVLKSLKL